MEARSVARKFYSLKASPTSSSLEGSPTLSLFFLGKVTYDVKKYNNIIRKPTYLIFSSPTKEAKKNCTISNQCC